MEAVNIAKQIVDFQKLAVETSFRAAGLIQKQVEEMAQLVNDRTKTLFEQNDSLVQQLLKVARESGDELKAASEEGFKKLDQMVNGLGKTGK